MKIRIILTSLFIAVVVAASGFFSVNPASASESGEASWHLYVTVKTPGCSGLQKGADVTVYYVLNGRNQSVSGSTNSDGIATFSSISTDIGSTMTVTASFGGLNGIACNVNPPGNPQNSSCTICLSSGTVNPCPEI